MNVLLTGGAGYIGSHAAIALSEVGHDVILLDNFCNSNHSVLNRLEKILDKKIPCIQTDIRNTQDVVQALLDYRVDSVIHFAGLKAVGESVNKPIQYYANNVQGTISLLEAMKLAQVKSLVFSSSATVYGDPQYLPIDEGHPTGATNAYGRTKLHIEEMLKDVANSDADWKILCLRYFNPVGAHSSGYIGEDPDGIPNNLSPFVAQVAAGKRDQLSIYGNDYPTPDGTGVRDYIHVVDLAAGHLAALNYLPNHHGWDAINLGTGNGCSVLDLVAAYEVASGKSISSKIVSRRAGDIAACYAKVDKARMLLGWQSELDLGSMCASSWKWQQFRQSIPD